MMEDSIQQARQILESQVEKLRAELVNLDERRQNILRTLSTAERGLAGLNSEKPYAPHFSIRDVSPNQFRGKKLASAIEEYLESVQRPASIDELLEALKMGNGKLGKTPGREWTNVKIAVSTNPGTFTRRGSNVTLKPRSTPHQY